VIESLPAESPVDLWLETPEGQQKKAAKKAEAERKKAEKKAKSERKKAEAAHRAAAIPAVSMQDEMERAQAKLWAAKQAKQQADLAEMQMALDREQHAEQAQFHATQLELAKLPLAERAARARISPQWIPDSGASSCMICTKAFGRRLGRARELVHHCHYCGWAVCAGCSQGKLPLHRWLDASPPHMLHQVNSAGTLRVCDLCVEQQVDKIKRSVASRVGTKAAVVVGAAALGAIAAPVVAARAPIYAGAYAVKGTVAVTRSAANTVGAFGYGVIVGAEDAATGGLSDETNVTDI